MEKARRLFYPAIPLSFLCATSCAYYNGMFNAKRYVKQAEHAERDGRVAAALDGWRLASIHAESVVTRHPRSRWADDAQLIRARALVHMEQWNEAVVVSAAAVNSAQGFEQRREAWLNLGRANIGGRRYLEAIEALDSAAESHEHKRRSEALYYRGRAWLALDRPDRALADFRASDARQARFGRTRAALALGDPVLAAAFADTLLAMPYQEADWLPVLDSLGHYGMTPRAAQIVDRLVQRHDVTPASRARLLMADGDRWAAAGSDSLARHRFRDVTRLVPDSAEARSAAVRLVRLDLRTVTDSNDIARLRGLLEAIAAIGGTPGQEAGELVHLFDRADSLAAQAEAADAWWLARGELLRDSLGAGAWATLSFGEMADRFPDSPWTPKGLLAAIAGGHPRAEELAVLMRTRYEFSPYTRAVVGPTDDAQGFAMLEDSLRVVLNVSAPGARTPTTTDNPDQEDDIRSRRARVARPAARPTTQPSPVEP
jgi:tetratricopeptide (TPR) repeat protein